MTVKRALAVGVVGVFGVALASLLLRGSTGETFALAGLAGAAALAAGYDWRSPPPEPFGGAGSPCRRSS